VYDSGIGGLLKDEKIGSVFIPISDLGVVNKEKTYSISDYFINESNIDISVSKAVHSHIGDIIVNVRFINEELDTTDISKVDLITSLSLCNEYNTYWPATSMLINNHVNDNRYVSINLSI
jgi:hypothetical protein